MEKTRVRNSMTRLINLDDEAMLDARWNLIREIASRYGEPQMFCHTSVWQIEENKDRITITIDTYDCVIEIESELTCSDLIINFENKWVVAHIDCATTSVSELINRICDIYSVDRIF